jgi:hypothetical protein
MKWWVKILICVGALIVSFPLAYFHAGVIEGLGMKASPLSCMATYFIVTLFCCLPSQTKSPT